MTKCKNCGYEVDLASLVDDGSPKCSKCGSPLKMASNTQVILFCVGVILIAYFLNSTSEDKEIDSACANSPTCAFADTEFRSKAETACEDLMRTVLDEKYPYEYKIETGFTKFFIESLRIEKGVYIFTGKNLKLQNKFGAYMKKSYECHASLESIINITADFVRVLD